MTIRRIDPGGSDRVLVNTLGGQSLGWIPLSALTCQTEALVDPDTGLSERAFIRQPITSSGSDDGVPAFFSPVSSDCRGSCPRRGKFQIYFVFAKQNGRLLLSLRKEMEPPDSFIGWIDQENILDWETAVAIRPTEELTYVADDGSWEIGTICGFPTEEMALGYVETGSLEGCQAFMGGGIWFTFEQRLAVIEESERVLKVGFPFSGVGEGNATQTDDGRLIVNLDALNSDDSLDALEGLKSIDIVFVIDGTESMAPALSALVGGEGRSGIVEIVSEQLSEDIALGGDVQFMFQVFGDRSTNPDSPYGESGLGTRYPTSGLGCDRESIAENNAGFRDALSRVGVQAVIPADDDRPEDFAENIWGGIDAGLRLLAPCPDRIKVMVVIGDHGYNPDRQRQRGFTPHSQSRLLETMRGRFSERYHLFFVQMPVDYSTTTNIPDYNRSYRWFEDQAIDLLSGRYGESGSRGSDRIRNFIALDGRTTIENANLIATSIKDLADGLLNVRIVEDLIVNLQSGESVRRALQRLIPGYSGVPGLFWNMLETEACAAVGAQCSADRLSGTGILYVPKTSDIVSDVFAFPEDFNRWEKFLAPFAEDLRVQDARKYLAANIIRSLEQTVGVTMQAQNQTIGEFLEGEGYLPDFITTPLMEYTFDEILDPAKVATCEIEHLQRYARKSLEIIEKLKVGNVRPVFQRVYELPDNCPFSTKARKVPSIIGRVGEESWGNDEEYDEPTRISFDDVRGVNLFWVPTEYVP